MKYGIFTASEKAFDKQCEEILNNHPHYKGYRSLPLIQWTAHRMFLRDGTDIHWIDPTENLEFQLLGLKFNRIYVLDGVSKLDLLEHVFPRWYPDLS